MSLDLRIAAAQFPVTADIPHNWRHIRRQIQTAANNGADIVHFPETALCGYGPKHFNSFDDFPWQTLAEHEAMVREAAAANDIGVILGTMRQDRQDGSTKPRNCVQVISNGGVTIGVYDKRKLYGREAEFYNPGTDALTIKINGHTCGFLICYDNCFPELYEHYRRSGVSVLFHSFFNAENSVETPIKDMMWANLIVRAADHGFWISASNSCSRYSPLPACIVKPDASVVSTKRHAPGLVYCDYNQAAREALGWTYDNRSSATIEDPPV